jgi:hypothetical protein
MSAALAAPTTAFTEPTAVPNFKAEKCRGIVKAALNDCLLTT